MTHHARHALVKRRGRRTVVALATAAVAVAGLAVATPANAILFGKLNTTTTLSVSPAAATEGTAITLNAAVKIAVVNSLGVLPTGTVTFKAKNALGAVSTIGTANLRECFLVPCHAILTTSLIPVGTTTAIAVYNGDSHTNGSQGSTPLVINPNPNPGSSSVVECFPGQACSSGTLTSDANDSTTQMEVSSPSSGTTQTITSSLSEGNLHCVEPPEPGEVPDGDDDDGVWVGALAEWHVVGGTGTKTVTYTGVGDTGRIMKHQLAEHPTHAGCFGADYQFYGFTNGQYGLAPFIEEDGLYEAMLPTCQFRTNRLPCMTGAGPGDGSSYSYKLRVKAGDTDPKFI